jgi:hypothetical protein
MKAVITGGHEFILFCFLWTVLPCQGFAREKLQFTRLVEVTQRSAVLAIQSEWDARDNPFSPQSGSVLRLQVTPHSLLETQTKVSVAFYQNASVLLGKAAVIAVGWSGGLSTNANRNSDFFVLHQMEVRKPMNRFLTAIVFEAISISSGVSQVRGSRGLGVLLGLSANRANGICLQYAWVNGVGSISANWGWSL